MNDSPTKTNKSAKAFARTALKMFAHSDSGAIAILFALMLPIIIGFVGLGVDAGMWFKEKRSMQTATDAAAVSAAIERALGATDPEMIAIAKSEATRHGFVDGVDTLTLNSNFVHNGMPGHVEVTIVHPLQTFLSTIFSSIAAQSNTRAVATTTGNIDACMLSLAGSGVGISVGSATVNMNGCGVFANSNGTANPNQSIKVGNGTLSADCAWSHGAIDATVGTVTNPVANQDLVVADDCNVMENVPVATDPFANLAVPNYNPSACQNSNLNISGGTLTNAYGSGNLSSPTVICGGISLNSSNTLNVEPGVYIIHAGDLSINGGATLNAPGVTFILAGSPYGGAKINGAANVTWSAPTVADYSFMTDASPDGNGNYMGTDHTNYTGISLFQSAPAAGTPGSVSLNGGANASISGAIYAPNNQVKFGGNFGLMTSDCLQLIGNDITFNGNATINNNCAAYGGNPANFGAVPGLVE